MPIPYCAGCKTIPLSASMDHVIPLKLGGEDSEGNIRLAHLGCNLRRGILKAAQQRMTI